MKTQEDETRQGRLTWSTYGQVDVLPRPGAAEQVGSAPIGYASEQAFRSVTPAGCAGEKHEEDIVADTYNGYCVKCKEKRDFQGEVAVSKTGMKMAKGACPVCGTTVNRILGKA